MWRDGPLKRVVTPCTKLTVVRNQKTWSRERQNRAPGSAPDLHETGSDADPTPCLLSRVVLGDGAMSSSPA